MKNWHDCNRRSTTEKCRHIFWQICWHGNWSIVYRKLGSILPYADFIEHVRRMKISVLDSIVVSILACHVRDPGSIPGRGGNIFIFSTRKSRTTATHYGLLHAWDIDGDIDDHNRPIMQTSTLFAKYFALWHWYYLCDKNNRANMAYLYLQERHLGVRSAPRQWNSWKILRNDAKMLTEVGFEPTPGRPDCDLNAAPWTARPFCHMISRAMSRLHIQLFVIKG